MFFHIFTLRYVGKKTCIPLSWRPYAHRFSYFSLIHGFPEKKTTKQTSNSWIHPPKNPFGIPWEIPAPWSCGLVDEKTMEFPFRMTEFGEKVGSFCSKGMDGFLIFNIQSF